MVWIGFVDPGTDPSELPPNVRLHIGRRMDDATERRWWSDVRKRDDKIAHRRHFLSGATDATSHIAVVIGRIDRELADRSREAMAWVSCRQRSGSMILSDPIGHQRARLQRGESATLHLPVRIQVFNGGLVCDLWMTRGEEGLRRHLAASRSLAPRAGARRPQMATPTITAGWDPEMVFAAGPTSWQYVVVLGAAINAAFAQHPAGRVVSRADVLKAVNRHHAADGRATIESGHLTTLYRTVCRSLGLDESDLKDVARRTALLVRDWSLMLDADVQKFRRLHETHCGPLFS